MSVPVIAVILLVGILLTRRFASSPTLTQPPNLAVTAASQAVAQATPTSMPLGADSPYPAPQEPTTPGLPAVTGTPAEAPSATAAPLNTPANELTATREATQPANATPTATVSNLPASPTATSATSANPGATATVTGVPPSATSGPTLTPTLAVTHLPNGWALAGANNLPDPDENRNVSLVFGELINNTGSPQVLEEITGTFTDTQNQVLTEPNVVVDGFWPADLEVLPPGGRTPFLIEVRGSRDVARFQLSAASTVTTTVVSQNFSFLNFSQGPRTLNGLPHYCAQFTLRNPGPAFQNIIVVAVTFYNAQNRVVNFGDAFLLPEDEGLPITGDQTEDFEICVAAPNEGIVRSVPQAWGY